MKRLATCSQTTILFQPRWLSYYLHSPPLILNCTRSSEIAFSSLSTSSHENHPPPNNGPTVEYDYSADLYPEQFNEITQNERDN